MTMKLTLPNLMREYKVMVTATWLNLAIFLREFRGSFPRNLDSIGLQNTRVGDSSTGYGFEDGIFSFMTTFYKNSDTIVVYPTEPKEFSEILADPITTQNPPKIHLFA